MYEKVNATRDWLIDTFIEQRNCDTLQERKEWRDRLLKLSRTELICAVVSGNIPE